MHLALRKYFYTLTAFLSFTMLFFSSEIVAQDQLSVTHSEAEEGKDLTISISFPLAPIATATVRYKVFENADWRTIEARPQGNQFVATIPGNLVVPPSLSYYVQARLADGRNISFPVSTPSTTPVQVTVKPKPEDERLFIISPAQGEQPRAEDLVIVYSFYRIADKVDRLQMIITKNDSKRDVTNKTVKTENTITYVPDEDEFSDGGVYNVEVIAFGKDNKPLARATNNFSISAAGKFDEFGQAVPPPPAFTFLSDSWVEARQEKQTFARSVQSLIDPSLPPTFEFVDTNLTYLRFNTNFDSKVNGWLRVGGNLYITNEDRPDAQPANRYLVKLETDYVSLRYGDNFPEYSFYLSNGVRVRGIEADVRLGDFRATVMQGEANRSFDAVFDTTIIMSSANDTIAAVIDRDRQLGIGGIWTLVDSTAATRTYRRLTTTGAFRRNLTTGVVGVDGQHFKFMLQALQSRDDIGPTALNTRGVAPQDNFALGGTLMMSVVPEHVDLFADFGFSLYNRDIAGGSLTPEQFERLSDGKITADRLQNVPGGYDNLTRLITLNTNFTPLNPLDLSSIAYRAGANVTVGSNFLRAEFINQGQNYQSFGLAFYQPDIRGFRINDRLRLFSGKVIVNAGFENMQDNLLGLRNRQLSVGDFLDGTVTRQMIRGGISSFLGGGIPNVRFEAQVISNTNNIPLVFQDSIRRNETGGLEILGNRSGLSSRVDNTTMLLNGDIQRAFTIAENHELSFSLLGTLISRKDNRDFSRPATIGNGTTSADSIRYSPIDLTVFSQDFTSRNVGLNVNYSIPNSIRASLSVGNQGLSYFSLDEAQNAFEVNQSFTSVDATLGYNFLDDKLRPSLRASFTFGDFSRTLLGIILTYEITPQMNLAGDFAYSTVGGIVSNGVNTPSTNNIVAAVRYQILFGN